MGCTQSKDQTASTAGPGSALPPQQRHASSHSHWFQEDETESAAELSFPVPLISPSEESSTHSEFSIANPMSPPTRGEISDVAISSLDGKRRSNSSGGSGLEASQEEAQLPSFPCSPPGSLLNDRASPIGFEQDDLTERGTTPIVPPIPRQGRPPVTLLALKRQMGQSTGSSSSSPVMRPGLPNAAVNSLSSGGSSTLGVTGLSLFADPSLLMSVKEVLELEVEEENAETH